MAGERKQAARHLRDARRAAGFSKRALARELGAHFPQKTTDSWERDLGRWENHGMIPHGSNATALACVLPEYDLAFVAGLRVSPLQQATDRIATLNLEVRELRDEVARLRRESQP